MTLVIETGSVETDRAASASPKPDKVSDSLTKAEAAPANENGGPTLDQVITQRLQEAERQREANAKASQNAEPNTAPQPTNPETLKAAGQSAAVTGQTAGQTTPGSRFGSPEASVPPSGTVSITQMLASKLNEDNGSTGTGEPETAGASATQNTTGARETAAQNGTPSQETNSAAKTTISLQEIGSGGEQATDTDAPANQQQPQNSEMAVAALEPQSTQDPRSATASSDAPDTTGSLPDSDTAPGVPQNAADQPSGQQTTPGERLAAADAPALPLQRSNFQVQGRIALIIRGLGVKSDLTERTIDQLPSQVAMAFVPYGDNVKDWTARAHSGRHDILLQIPLEPEDYPDTNPGPHTLLTSLPIDENLKRLDWLLDRFDNISGVTNYLGGKFASSPGGFAPVLMELKARDLLYVDDSKAANPTTSQLARQISLGYSVADIVIDKNRSPDAINAALAELEAKAKAEGAAIAIGHAHADTLAALEGWLETVNDKGLVLVRISELTAPKPARVSQSTGG